MSEPDFEKLRELHTIGADNDRDDLLLWLGSTIKYLGEPLPVDAAEKFAAWQKERAD